MSDGNRNFSVMTGTLLYVVGSCERHSQLTEEMYTPLVHVNVIPNLQKRCTPLGSCERHSQLTEEMYTPWFMWTSFPTYRRDVHPLVHVNVIPNLQKKCTPLGSCERHSQLTEEMYTPWFTWTSFPTYRRDVHPLVHVNVIPNLQMRCTPLGSCERHSQLTDEMYTPWFMWTSFPTYLQKRCTPLGSCERHSQLTEEMYTPWFMWTSFPTYRRDVHPLVHVNVIPNLQKRCTPLGSCERHSQLTEEMYTPWFMWTSFPTYRRDVNPFETDTKGRLFGVDVSINWPSNKWVGCALDWWKATQLNLPRQKRVNIFLTKKIQLHCVTFHVSHRFVGLVVKASASRAEDPGFESRLCRDFSGVESYQWLKNWHSSGYPARRLALKGQFWDRSARCQYTVTGWDGKFDLQLLFQCGSTSNCLGRSVPEIHSHVAGTLSKQATNKQTSMYHVVWSANFCQLPSQ